MGAVPAPLRPGVAAILALAGCAGLGSAGPQILQEPLPPTEMGGQQEVQDGPPELVPEGLADLPDPVPTDDPPSIYGNPPSYEVFGKTYNTMTSAIGYQVEGLASWYGTKFHGQRTSSGEPYNMYKLTAAHRSLPIPTYVQVTNLDNGRQTLVRVNDRGPFHADRILDLSFAAAVKLGFAKQGVAKVRIEALDAEQELYLQAGAFRGLEAAQRLQRNLQTLTGEPTKVVTPSQDALYRVHIGPVRGEQRARELQSMVTAANYALPIVLWLGEKLAAD